MSALVVAVLAASAWWLDPQACPRDAKLTGAAPPAGTAVMCMDAAGALHGRSTRWHPGTGAPRKEEGAYRRGVAHGRFTWWKKDGKKALEGEYWAGKKTGRWTRWDDKGNPETSEHPRFEQSEAAIDAAISEALKGAGGKTIDSATTARAAAATTDDLGGARGGGGEAEAITTHAALGGRGDDITDVDMGKASFDNGGGEEASPYIRKAVKLAGGVVDRCYRGAKKKVKGEIVVRWTIDGEGKVTDVRVVKSALSGDVGDCIKAGIKKLELEPHGDQPIEVISPWRLVPPK